MAFTRTLKNLSKESLFGEVTAAEAPRKTQGTPRLVHTRIDGVMRGVPVILPTSKAGDGAKTGYDLPVIRGMKDATAAEIVASGGAGS